MIPSETQIRDEMTRNPGLEKLQAIRRIQSRQAAIEAMSRDRSHKIANAVNEWAALRS